MEKISSLPYNCGMKLSIITFWENLKHFSLATKYHIIILLSKPKKKSEKRYSTVFSRLQKQFVMTDNYRNTKCPNPSEENNFLS